MDPSDGSMISVDLEANCRFASKTLPDAPAQAQGRAVDSRVAPVFLHQSSAFVLVLHRFVSHCIKHFSLILECMISSYEILASSISTCFSYKVRISELHNLRLFCLEAGNKVHSSQIKYFFRKRAVLRDPLSVEVIL